MNWKSEMDELKRREKFAEGLGGAERVKRQHDGGRYTIRERIDRLADPQSFHEIGKIAGKASYDARSISNGSSRRSCIACRPRPT